MICILYRFVLRVHWVEFIFWIKDLDRIYPGC
jgi:hypothetical protein